MEIPLNRVFVSLRGYPGSASEISQATILRTREDRYEEPSIWQDRDLQGDFTDNRPESVDLAEAFQRHRAMVVLGDPGSGKTTMARWLALAFAKAYATGEPSVLVPENAVAPNFPRSNQKINLGATRLPIYLRIADLAKEYRRRDKLAVLADMLGDGVFERYPVYLTDDERRGERIDSQHLMLLFKDALRRQRAVVFLDGLDEIPNPQDRGEIVKLVHGFLDSFITGSGEAGKSNQLLMTSRIIGYEEHPLRDSVSRYTIDRLSEPAIGEFIDCWHSACAKKLASKGQSPEEASRLASMKFKNQVFDPEREALRELASNSFMLSLLCVLNQEHNQKLPTSRASLYEMLVDRGLRSLFLEKREAHRKLGDLIGRVLMLLANRMHTTSSNGLLPDREIEGIIWDTVLQDHASAQAIESSKEAFRLVVESVGLLDERGDGQYGFKHQTIQEFLAGKLLVQNETAAAGNLINKTTDPRWREAVLLGLGALCQSLPEERKVVVCRELAAKTGVIPSGAILLAQVMREFAPVPLEIVGTTVEILLTSYMELGALQGNARFSAFVELFVGDLLTRPVFPSLWRLATERVCANFAGTGNKGHSYALARLLLSRRLTVPSIATTLLGALHLDGSESRWIVNRTLEMMATSEARRIVPTRPVTEAVCRKLSLQTLETLRNPKVFEAVRYVPGSRVVLPQQDTEIAIYLLPFREALEQMPGAMEFIQGNVHWLRLVTTLYGGLGSFDAVDLRNALQDGKVEIISAVSGRADAERIARFLDIEVLPEWEYLKGKAPMMNAKWMYRDSPLTPLLVHWLHEKLPLQEALPQLHEIWKTAGLAENHSLTALFRDTPAGSRLTAEEVTEVLLSDALLALMACSALTSDILLSPPPSPLHERALRRFRGEMERTLEAARDPLLRVRSSLEKVFEVCAAGDYARATNGEIAPDPTPAAAVDPDELQLSADTEEASQQLSALWASLIRGGSPESVHRTAILLDCTGQQLSKNPEALFRSWSTFLDPGRRTWPHPREGDFPSLAMASDSPDGFLAACIGGVACLPAEFEFLQAFALSRMAPLFEKTPHLRTLAVSLALALPSPRYRKAALAAFYAGDETYDEDVIRREIFAQATSALPEHAIVAFWALRYVGSADREEWRCALLDCALRVQPIRAQAAALMQTAIILKSFAEEDVARKELAALLPQTRDSTDWELLEHFLRSPEPVTPSTLLTAWREVAEFLEELRVDTPTPLAFVDAQNADRQAALVAMYFRSLFLNDTEDREYSIAVVLDTAGKKLNLSPRLLMLALADSLPLALDLRWDTSGLLPALSSSKRNKYLDSLLFLAVVPQSFDFFAAWALSRIGKFISLTASDWTPLLAILGARISEAYRPLAMAGLDERLRALPQEQRPAELQREALAIGDPLVRFHTLRLCRKTGTPAPCLAILDAADKVHDTTERILALSNCLIEFANEILAEGAGSRVEEAIGRCDRPDRIVLLSLLSVVAPRYELSSEKLRVERHQAASFNVGVVFDPAGQQKNQSTGSSRVEIESRAMQWLTARARSVTEPRYLAVLALILNGLGAKRLLALLPSPSSASDWDLLADPAKRPQALAALAAKGIKEGLQFDDGAAKSIREWADRGEDFALLAPILPLVSGGPPTATPQLEEWFVRYPSQVLGQWACVMLAERDRWSGAVVDSLVALLRHHNDLLRNRAAIAIMLTDRLGRLAQSSAMGDEAVFALAKASTKVVGMSSDENHALPDSVLTPVRWAFEQLIIDTPGLLTRLGDEYANGGNQLAHALYRRLNYVSPLVRREIAILLSGTLPSRLRVDLMHGLIALWERAWHRLKDDDPELAEIRTRLWEGLDHDDPEKSFVAAMSLGFMGGRHDIQRLADLAFSPSPQRAMQIRMLSANTMSPVSHAREFLNQGSVLFQTLLNLLGEANATEAVAAGEFLLRMAASPEEVRNRMRNDAAFLDSCFSSVSFYFIGDRYYVQLRRIARGIEQITSRQIEVHGVQGNDVFTMALRKANELMAAGAWRSSDLHSANLCEVLPVCAAAAELMPDTYRRIVENFLPDGFREKLEVAVRKGDAFTLRQAGLVLLALLRNFSVYMGRALTAASADAFPVQHVAIRQIRRLRDVDSYAIAKLEELLTSPSANICYVATRIIIGTLQNQNLTVEVRRLLRERAILALSHAAERVDPNQIVSLLESGDDIFKPRIRNVGLLKDILNSALLELSSVYLGSEGQEQSASETAHVVVKTEAAGERQTFNVWLGEHAANGAFPNQRIWIEKVLRLQVPQEATDALNDLQKVAGEAGVSCAALALAAQRLESI